MGKLLINTGPSERGWHRLELALRCEQLYAYDKILGLNMGHKVALVRGSLVHVGNAHFYARIRAAQQGTDPEAYYEPMEAMQLASVDFGDMGSQLLPLCQRIMHEYINQHATDQFAFKVVAIEEQVRAMLKDRYLLTQRWDTVVEDRSGYIWIIDHKTTARPTRATHQRYAMSGQFAAAQLIGQKMFGQRFAGVKINVIGAVEPFKFYRESLPPVPYALSKFADSIVELEDRLAKYEAEGRDPWSYPRAYHEHACMTAYGRCPGFTLCQYGPSNAQQWDSAECVEWVEENDEMVVDK